MQFVPREEPRIMKHFLKIISLKFKFNFQINLRFPQPRVHFPGSEDFFELCGQNAEVLMLTVLHKAISTENQQNSTIDVLHYVLLLEVGDQGSSTLTLLTGGLWPASLAWDSRNIPASTTMAPFVCRGTSTTCCS